MGEDAAYLQDGMEVMIDSYEGSVIGVTLPETVVLEVTETEPVVKGQTAASSYKPAVLENGVRTTVPPFVGTGDKVVINTEDGSYAKRADA
jgi:elongation factor P